MVSHQLSWGNTCYVNVDVVVVVQYVVMQYTRTYMYMYEMVVCPPKIPELKLMHARMYLNEPFSTRLTANVVFLSGTPECQ